MSECRRSGLGKTGFLFLFMLLCSLFLATAAAAQQKGGRLEISSAEVASPSNIILRAYAVDASGQPIRLEDNNILILHNGVPVPEYQVVGDYQAGTFTVFIVDIPVGIEDKLPAIQGVIEQFANVSFMKERADYVAIYRVGAADAEQIMGPSSSISAVQDHLATTPLKPTSDQTALADSVGNLLGQISYLNPKGDMSASIVLITDGTDVVSKQHKLENLAGLAESLQIPIHTIWIENEKMPQATRIESHDFLTGLANQSQGLSADLNNPESFSPIWQRIGARRNHQVIEYSPEVIHGGANDVTLSMTGIPGMQKSIEIHIPESAPSVEIVLPPESREISLETLEDPVKLSFSATVSWLDDILREVATAELLVNQVPVYQIPVNELDKFTTEISYFSFGPNDIQVRIEDELGQIATSPSLQLNVIEGEKAIPEEMQPSGISDSPIFRTGLLCGAIILVIAILAFIIISISRLGIRDRLRRNDGYDYPETAADDGSPRSQPSATGFPYLEVISSVTRLPPILKLLAGEIRLGRSAVMADIAFENDITVSRLHASIVVEGNSYRIYDEGSSSGTWVNNHQVPEYGYHLQDGDEIRLGDALLRFRR